MPGGGAGTLGGLLRELARRVGTRPALLTGEEAITFAELEERAARIAGGLAELGVGRGDRIALWLPNVPAWLELHLAAARLGALTVAINTRFRARDAGEVLRRSEAVALAVAPGFKGIDFVGMSQHAGAPGLRIDVGQDAGGISFDRLREHAPARDEGRPGDPCVTFTSSGTTGRPKLVVHAQRGIAAHARAVAAGFGYDRPGCVVLGLLPLCGVFGYDSVLGALAGGAPVALADASDPQRAAALASRHRATHANASDTMLLRLLEAAPDPPLREAGFATFDGDARRVVDAAQRAGTAAYMCYGSTEVQALLAHAPADAAPERRAVAGGRPADPATEVRVRSTETGELLGAGEEGELEVRGPSVMAGYLDDPEEEAFTPDGFVHTGDLGRLTGDGFAYVARRGDALRLGGFLVSPREIEGLLEDDAAVAEACVVAAEQDGVQRPVAFVTPAGPDSPDADALLETCRRELAGFKAPRRIVVLDELPTTDGPNGRKVRRAELRERAAAVVGDPT